MHGEQGKPENQRWYKRGVRGEMPVGSRSSEHVAGACEPFPEELGGTERGIFQRDSAGARGLGQRTRLAQPPPEHSRGRCEAGCSDPASGVGWGAQDSAGNSPP